jgi:transcriptional regulator with XRE-family HTH domain
VITRKSLGRLAVFTLVCFGWRRNKRRNKRVYMQSISERLKILRGTDSQQKFAESIGLRQTTYGQYERGQSNPDSDTLSAI